MKRPGKEGIVVGAFVALMLGGYVGLRVAMALL